MKQIEEVKQMVIESSNLGTAISIAINVHGAKKIKRCVLVMGTIWQVWL